MKAILILDMPSCCNNCPCYDGMEDRSCCNFLEKDIGDNILIIDKDCPLKPLPSKKTISEEMVWNTKYENKASYYSGYNACIDEILTMNEEIIKEDNENRY